MRSIIKFLLHLFTVCILAGFTFPALADNHSPEGFWRTYDTVTKEPLSIVKISENNGDLTGTVVKIYKNPKAVCVNCSGQLHNKPVMGMTVLWGFTKGNNGWSTGKILSVRKGAIYTANITLVNENELQLSVKSSFGKREVVWTRVANSSS